MRMFFSYFFCIALCSTCAYSQSTILNFDDVTGNQAGNPNPTPIANGYQGFDWNNFYIENATSFPQSGILNGAVSSPNVVASLTAGFPQPTPYTASLSSDNPFILVSGYFTAAFENNMSLEITGFNGTTKVFDQTFTLNVTGPSFLTFPSSSLTEVDFLPSGGTLPGPGYLSGGPEMILDNLTVEATPEPSSICIGAAGLMLVAVFKRR